MPSSTVSLMPCSVHSNQGNTYRGENCIYAQLHCELDALLLNLSWVQSRDVDEAVHLPCSVHLVLEYVWAGTGWNPGVCQDCHHCQNKSRDCAIHHRIPTLWTDRIGVHMICLYAFRLVPDGTCPSQSQSSRLNHPDYIRWTVQTMTFLMWSLLHSPFSSKYLSQDPVFKYP